MNPTVPWGMSFDMDVMEDIPMEVDELMRLGALGKFGEARDRFQAIFEDNINEYPVIAEYVRLLYDQGDFEALEVALKQYHDTVEASDDPEDQSPELRATRLQILDLLRAITTVYRNGATRANVTFASRSVGKNAGSSVSEMSNLTEDEVWLQVLQLRVKYISHTYVKRLPMSHFSLPWNNDITLEALCPWITGLLGQDRYWHAQQVLEICFRRTGAETYILHLDRIWDAISFFVQLNEKAHESKLLASLALLQTFCEGTMRRLRGKCMDNTQWNTAWRLMQETNTLLCQVVGHQDWEISRPCLNMKLLDIDRDILSVLGEAQSDDESAKDTTLLAIMRQSMFHCDRTLYHAAKWRYAVLLYAVNSANCSMPLAIAGSIPHEIYTGWQQYSIRTLRKKAQENPGTYLASKRAEYTRQTTKQLPLTLYPVSNKLPAAPTFKRTILFIGDIRTGKSTFIETLTGKHTGTSEDIVSCTSAIEGHILRFGDSIVECFDTPGFNDSRAEMSNYSVVEQIGLFLRGEAKTPRRVHGVIFMINIKKAKATADFKQSLDILHAILGDDAWKNTCVVYTHGVGSEQRGARARDDRRLEKKHLSGLMSQFPLAGRNVKTFGLVLDYTNDELLDAEGDTDDEQDHDDDDSATNTRSETYSSSSEDDSLKPHVFRPVQKDQASKILRHMLEHSGPLVLRLQQEMCSEGKFFSVTTAGILCHWSLLASQEGARAQLVSLQRVLDDSIQRLEHTSGTSPVTRGTRHDMNEMISDIQASPSIANANTQPTPATTLREVRSTSPPLVQTLQDEANSLEMMGQNVNASRLAGSEAAEKHRKQTQDRETEKLRKEKQIEEAQNLRKERELQIVRKETEELQKELEQLRQEQAALGNKMRMYKEDIERIENSPGYVPRFLIHNKTQVVLHARAYNTPGHIVQNYKNSVEPDAVVAIECSPGLYGIDLCLDTGGTSSFTTTGQVLNSAVKASGVAIAAGGAATVAGATIAIPLLLGAAIFGLAYLWTEGKQSEDEGTKIAILETGKGGAQVEKMKQLMLAAKQGKHGLGLTSYKLRSLILTTRLEVIGGPEQRLGGDGSVEYVFHSDTKPIEVKRVKAYH